jgi:hypothetical protein
MRDLPTPEDIRDAIARETDISAANFPQKISMEDTDTAWKLYAGYWFNAHFGLELSYADLGEGCTTGFRVSV